MRKCKYIYKEGMLKDKQCPHEALPGSDFCKWHKPKDGKDFFGQEIQETNLAEACLVKANLENTKFKKHENLSFTNFKDADLWGANFKGASLTGANFQGVKLWQANFQGANLSGANFEGSYSIYRTHQMVLISIANLQDQELKTVNFKGVYSHGTIFKKSNLYKADFRGAYLKSADFSGCSLKEADFTGSYLTGANLNDANLMEANLKGAFLYGLSLNGTKNLQYAGLSRAIEEIIGDIILKLGVPKQGYEEEKYWQRFSSELFELLQLSGETKENSKIIIDSIINQTHCSNIDTKLTMFNKSGNFYVKAIDVYLNLKNYFRYNGLYELSGKFYILKQTTEGKIQMVNFLLSLDLICYRIKTLYEKAISLIKRNKKLAKDNKQVGIKTIDLRSYPYTKHIASVSLAQDIKDLSLSLIGWIGNMSLKVTSLYGESPLRVILTAIEIILIFAMGYTTHGLNSNTAITHAIGNSLYFSLLTFITMSFGEFSPTTPDSRAFAGIEAFLGAFILAYFVVVVSRKIMR